MKRESSGRCEVQIREEQGWGGREDKKVQIKEDQFSSDKIRVSIAERSTGRVKG
jgi:hypothetical protein